MFLEAQLYLPQALEMVLAAREELPLPQSLPHPGRVTACTVQMPMETESVIITRTDPASTQMPVVTESVIIIRTGPASTQIRTVTGSVIIIRRKFPPAWHPAVIMEPAITEDGETAIIKEGWKKRCEVRKKPEGPLICTGTQ